MNEKKHTIPSINPANGESLGDFELHTAAEINEIINRAKNAQISWAELTIDERINHLQSVHKIMLEEADNIVKTISRDNGKTKNDALVSEVIPAILALKYYCKKAKKFLSAKRLQPGSWLMVNKRSKINKIPYGVIGIISPWNYPFAIPFSELIMALLAGNTVILKVASETLAVGDKIAEIFRKSSLPENVFNYVNAPGRMVGPAMLSAGIDKIFFTGSVPVGKSLMAEAAKTLTPVVLELGGNDAMIVCEDANLDRAAAGAVWGDFPMPANPVPESSAFMFMKKYMMIFLANLGLLSNRCAGEMVRIC